MMEDAPGPDGTHLHLIPSDDLSVVAAGAWCLKLLQIRQLLEVHQIPRFQ